MVATSAEETRLTLAIGKILHTHPAGGLATAVVSPGGLKFFLGSGVADRARGIPITEDTVFRVGSISKTFTAIAIMQLRDRGLIDLDDAASRYLSSFRLTPARASFGPVTIRQLLTHTGGIGELRNVTDVLRPTIGLAVPADRPPPSLATYYRGRLRVEVEPGTKWAYANHGFSVLGQLVEDVSGEPFGSYMRAHVFGPLGLDTTDFVRTDAIAGQLATGYALRLARAQEGQGPRHRGAGGRLGILHHRGHGTVRRGPAGRRRAAAESGKPPGDVPAAVPAGSPAARPWPGVLAQRGRRPPHRRARGRLARVHLGHGAGPTMAWRCSRSPTPVLDARPGRDALLRDLLGARADEPRLEVPERPAVWDDLCGWYGLAPGTLTNARPRMLIGGGAEVLVRGSYLMLRAYTPVPQLRRAHRLHADDPDDPYLFRLDFTDEGLGTWPVAFSRHDGARGMSMHVGVLPMSLYRRPLPEPGPAGHGRDGGGGCGPRGGGLARHRAPHGAVGRAVG